MKTLIVAVVAVGGLTSCAGRYPVIPEPAFDVAANRYATMQGSASVDGSGLLRQRGGGVVTCAGNEVWLIPDTPYFRWLITPTGSIDVIDFQSNSYPIPDRLLSVDTEYFRVTECDAQGNFAFRGVPAGSYMAITLVQWVGAGLPWEIGGGPQGGYVADSVTVYEDEPASVVIDTNIRMWSSE